MSYPVIRLHEIQGALGRRNRLDFGTVMPRVQIPSPDQIRIQSHPAGGFNVTSPVVVVNPPTGDFAVLADVVDVFPVCNRSFVPLAQVTVGAGQGQAGRSRSRRGCGAAVESNVSEHALTKKVSAIAVMAAPLRTVLKTMTWPGSYKRGRRAYQKALVAAQRAGRESLGAGLPELGAGRAGRAGKELVG